jgi:SAM-dependent methyltransferase
MRRDSEIWAVSEGRWKEAQQWEEQVWVSANRNNSWLRVAWKFVRALSHPRTLARYLRYRDYYCGDDWNYWWMDAMDGYSSLPKRIDKALEVGCGPYTNIRLISQKVHVKEIHCADPLSQMYKKFRHTWLAEQARADRVHVHDAKGEDLPFQKGEFDLTVCINVLDHVNDAMRCMEELSRVTAPGGFVVFGQDLTNEDDARRHAGEEEDIGHPILLHEETVTSVLTRTFEPVLQKALPREQGRNPDAHYKTLIFIGRKKE